MVTGGAAHYGGGAYGGRLVNVVLSGNDAVTDGGGACASLVVNGTVTGNTAGGYSGGMIGCGVRDCAVTNSIVCGNHNYGSPSQTNNWSDSSFGYSCTDPLPSGEGNICADPCFADHSHADFRLLSGSPCIDAGGVSPWLAGTDLLGASRLQGGGVDMGAYEASTFGDLDGDGLSDIEEVNIYGTSPARADTDGDGLDDAEEVFSRIMMWGMVTNTTTYVERPEHLGKLVKVSAANAFFFLSPQYNVALKESGDAVCWGFNTYGQCEVPASATNLVDVSAGWLHSAAISGDGCAVCWGSNGHGQCQPSADATGLVAVACGWYHNVALRNDGTVSCWGNNTYGQSVAPTGLVGVAAVAAGSYHTAALLTNGAVACWGLNTSGQCLAPSDLSNAVAVAAAGTHTLALRSDGTVVCWGNNASGQCSVPAGVTNVLAIAAGSAHSMAALADGRIVCWGLNSSGQAGGRCLMRPCSASTADPDTRSRCCRATPTRLTRIRMTTG